MTVTTPAPGATVRMRSWVDFEAACETRIPGYSRRPEQGRLAATVETALAEGSNGAFQAGTGTGKSYAYLVPALLRFLATGERTLVATATKNLQGQIADKDLPMLIALLAEITGREITFANLKGRSNYICQAQLADAHAGKVDLDPPTLARVTEITSERDEFDELAHDGDIAHFPDGVLDEAAARALTVSTDECPGKAACAFGDTCFAYKAKARAKDAAVVVTNHAMLAMDVITKVEEHDENEEFVGYKSVLLPDYDSVIVDEAHNLAGYVTSMAGAQLTARTFETLVSEAQNLCEDTELGKPLAATAVRLFGDLGRLTRGDERTARLTEDMLREISGYFGELRNGLLAVRRAVAALPRAADKRESARKARLNSRLDSLEGKLSVLDPRVADGPAGEVVRWVQSEERTFRGKKETRVTVGYSPLRVDGLLRERLWSDTNGVLLSATLRPADDETYIPKALGLDEYETFDAGSPFDYPNQAGLLITDHLNPQQSGWSNGGHKVTMDLIEASGGGALLLFTSRREMEARYQVLSQEIEDLGLTCYIQRPGMPTDELIRRKKAEPNSVVFGLKGLMEGVDVVGPALRLVILDKLPFPVPSEVVTAARNEAHDAAVAKAKGIAVDQLKMWDPQSAFKSLSVPAMALLLEQAFGRAIRSVDDRALVAILDNRISPRRDEHKRYIGKGYGREVFATLPPARDLPTVKHAVAYMKRITA